MQTAAKATAVSVDCLEYSTVSLFRLCTIVKINEPDLHVALTE